MAFHGLASTAQIPARLRIPAAAKAVGYESRTFSTQRFTTLNVDQTQRYTTGFQWYHWSFFGRPISRHGQLIDESGVITLRRGYANGNIVTAGRPESGSDWVGTVFGGGYYAEAEIEFEANAVDPARGWPAWWSVSIEHLAQTTEDKWAEQPPGYLHFVELDQFEYLRGPRQRDVYGVNVHEFHGVYGATCKPLCNVGLDYAQAAVRVPANTHWNRWHRIAVRVVPASANKRGEIGFYFDDNRVGPTVHYTKYEDQAPPPGAGKPWTYGLIDRQHMALILGAGETPMRVRSVNVWQSSDRDNITR